MIDIFNQLYTGLKNTFTTASLDIETSSVYVNMPSSYPFVSVEEIDNSIYQEGMDSGKIENFVNLDYELNIYTQNPTKKSKADQIVKVVDNYMSSLGFVRNTRYIVPTSDETIYRVVLRYHGVVSTSKTIFRR